MSDSHIRETSLVPDSLLDSVSLLSKKWHPAIVLKWIRSQRDDIRVVVVTSKDVDFEVLDMEFDEYLTKPARKAELQRVVADLFERRAYSEQLRENLALGSKLGLLQAEYPDETLESHELCQRLQSRLAELEPPDEAFDAETLKRVPIGGPQ